MLEFEHIVQVNDLANDNVTDITRSQLWLGLVLRARNPEKFNPGLECSSRQVAKNEFMRTIEVGQTSFCEHVVLYPEDKIRTSTVEDIEQISAESEARIEEPEEGYLFVRFRYKRELQKGDVIEDGVDVGEHLKAAYVQVDRDAVAMIRMLAESKLFDQLIS